MGVIRLSALKQILLQIFFGKENCFFGHQYSSSFKRNLKDKICNMKEFRAKFDMKRITLKLNLVFNWVCF